MHSKILILDFGSQVTQLIARRVRDAGVFSEVFPYDIGDDFVRNYGASGVILSGSHNSTLEGDSPRAPQAVLTRRPGAGHLLRHANHGRPARRQGRER